MRHDRQVAVRIDGGVAVAWEMLGYGTDAAGLDSPDGFGPELRHEINVRPERADADHRVERIGVDVDVGRQVHVDAHRQELIG